MAQLASILLAAEWLIALGAAIVLDNVEALPGITTVVGGHRAATGEHLQALAIVGADLDIVIGAGEVAHVGHRMNRLIQPDHLPMLVDRRQLAPFCGQHGGARSGGGNGKAN